MIGYSVWAREKRHWTNLFGLGPRWIWQHSGSKLESAQRTVRQMIEEDYSYVYECISIRKNRRMFYHLVVSDWYLRSISGEVETHQLGAKK